MRAACFPYASHHIGDVPQEPVLQALLASEHMCLHHKLSRAVCVRDAGAERASGACEHALPAHARANWVNRVNPVIPHPGSNGKRIVLEREVIGPLITSAPHWISRTAPSAAADGRRTGENTKTLCAAATDGPVLPRRGPPIEFPSTPATRVAILSKTHQQASFAPHGASHGD